MDSAPGTPAVEREPTRKYTRKERDAYLKMWDHDIATKQASFMRQLDIMMDQYNLHIETEIAKIHRPIRNLTMQEFADLGGDQRVAMRKLKQKAFEAANAPGEANTDVLASVRKRKYESEQSSQGDRMSKVQKLGPGFSSPTKNRIIGPASAVASGSKPTPKTPRVIRPGQATSNLTRTPGTTFGPPRQPNAFGMSTAGGMRSPSKLRPGITPGPTTGAATRRPPSTTQFNPFLSSTARGPAYPPFAGTAPRRAKRGESLMSINGSPIAFDEEDEAAATTPRAVQSSRPFPQRTASNQPTASSPLKFGTSMPKTPAPPPVAGTGGGGRRPGGASIVGQSGRIQVQTTDGRSVELDMWASPGELERMEDVSDSAKKTVREEMGRMHSALAKWSIRHE